MAVENQYSILLVSTGSTSGVRLSVSQGGNKKMYLAENMDHKQHITGNQGGFSLQLVSIYVLPLNFTGHKK